MSWVRRRICPELSLDTIPPPWASERGSIRSKIGAVGKAEGLRAFNQWHNSRHPLDLFVFSDGALIDNQAGAGYSVHRGLTHEVDQGKIPLGQSAEV